MFVRTATELFWLFVCTCVSWIWITGINAWTKRRYLDINYGHYRTKQTFIVELRFLGVHSDEDKQRKVNIYNAISDFCWLHNMADICSGCFGLWALYSDYCMVCFFGKVFLKSDTAVALRRSVSIIPCITLVLSSTFMLSISVNWRGSLHFHRMFWR